MQLEIQTHSGIRVIADVPSGSTAKDVKGIVQEALSTARASSEAWNEWTKKNETPLEKEMRELNEQMQKQQLKAMRAQVGGRGDAERLLRESL